MLMPQHTCSALTYLCQPLAYWEEKNNIDLKKKNIFTEFCKGRPILSYSSIKNPTLKLFSSRYFCVLLKGNRKLKCFLLSHFRKFFYFFLHIQIHGHFDGNTDLRLNYLIKLKASPKKNSKTIDKMNNATMLHY